MTGFSPTPFSPDPTSANPLDEVPDFLPSLASGAHDAGDGEACVMEYVSLLAGEEWSDRPDCTHPLLAHEARVVNDELDDADRHLLVPLIGRLFGTTESTGEIELALRTRQVAHVVRLLEPAARARVAAVSSGATEDGLAGLREVARAFWSVEPTSDRHGRLHERQAMFAWVALAADDLVDGDLARTLAALVAAHRVAASGECRADCGDTGAHARLKVRELRELLDAYDEATGRETTRLSPEQVRELADQVELV